jgi:glutamine amidotransferase-like uncharacterized protein
MRNKILIYCDYGTNNIKNLETSLKTYFGPRGIEITTTDANAIIKEDSLKDDVLAFFMPGGRATPYMEKLKVLGNQKINDYVRNGGIFFGICAGAYYASRNVQFETDIEELSIVQQCGLNLIDADAVGTLYKELEISPYTMDFTSIAAASVRWKKDGETHISCYHGGPYFRPQPDSRLEVLAEYHLKDKTLPAVVMQRHGNGFAIASGLHVEDSGKNFREVLFALRKDKAQAEKVIKILEKNENSRLALFQKMMSKIKEF